MLLAPGVVTLPSFFDIDEINEIKSFVQYRKMQFGSTSGTKTPEEKMKVKAEGSDYRKSKVYFIDRKITYTCEPFVKYDAAIEYANKTYLNQSIGDSNTWEFYQYADYSEQYQGYYKKHKDTGRNEVMRSRLLSASLQLTDPSEYDGGDLLIYLEDKIIVAPKEIGTITIFLSTTTHEVTPVTRGLRSSLVTWVH